MSCVVGIVDKGVVYLGGDTLVWGSDSYNSHLKEGNVWTKAGMVFGGTGYLSILNAVRSQWEIPTPIEGEDPMVRIILPSLAKLIKDIPNQHKADDDKPTATFLVGFQGRLYEFALCTAFSVEESLYPYLAIGAGREAAMGSLYSTRKSKMHPQKRLQLALEATAFCCPAVKGPFTFVSSVKE